MSPSPHHSSQHHSGPGAATALARIGLVLADGHALVLRGMQHLFEAESDIEVLASCTTDAATLHAVGRYKPSILVLDLSLPDHGGLAFARDFAARLSPTRVVLHASGVTDDEMTLALRLGISGVVLKEMPGLLVKCIRHVHQGGMWLENVSASRVVDRLIRREATLHDLKRTLTPRELQVMQLVAEGLQNKEITARLEITEGTVRIHLHNICDKLGLKDRAQLVCCAHDRALV